MIKVLVVGVGCQGAACASILARDKDISEIVLGDIDIDLANKVKNKINSKKITAVKLDAGRIEDGEYKRYPPFSGREEYDFAPFGKVLLVHHLHEEAAMLPYFIGKGLKYVDFKYPMDIQAGNLIQLGFASDKLIDIKGIKVSPWDILGKLVRSPTNDFFTEEAVAKSPIDFDKSLAIKVKGTKSGNTMEYTLSYPYPLFATTEERLELFRKFGTFNVYVALPAIVGAKMCVEGKGSKGIIGPECLDPLEFLKEMSAMGCPVKVHEVLSKEASIA